MKRVLFIQHGEVDQPGLFADVLTEAEVELQIFHPYLGQGLPTTMQEFDGLALGGGAQSAWQDDAFPYLSNECALVRAAFDAGKPVIGFCLGGQLMARALGARVLQASQRELGFFTVQKSPEAAEDPVMRHFPYEFKVAHWHADVFEIPTGGVRLASSAMTPNQVFCAKKGYYGFQFHPEMTTSLFEELLSADREVLIKQSVDLKLLEMESKRVLPAIEFYIRGAFNSWLRFL